MTKTKEGSQALADGESFGRQLIPVIKFAERGIVDEHDKLLWWAGFLGALSGIAAASIGEPAMQVLGDVFSPTVRKLLDENTH